MAGQDEKEVMSLVCPICKVEEAKSVNGLLGDGVTHRLCDFIKTSINATELHWAAALIDEQRVGKRKVRLAIGAGALGAVMSAVLGAVLGTKAARRW